MNSILFVSLPCKPIYPIGTAYLATYIHSAHPEVRQKIIDLSLIQRPHRRRYLREAIASCDSGIIAFSWRDIQVFAPHEGDTHLKAAFDFYYSWNPFKKAAAALSGLASILRYQYNIYETLALIRETAQAYPGKTILVGGGAFSTFSEQLIRRLPEGVIGVLGEGEDVLLKIVERKDLSDERIIFRRGNDVVQQKKNAPVDISTIAMDLSYLADIFPQHQAYWNSCIGIQTKRGCLYDCAFCIYPYIEGKRIRYRPPSQILHDITQHYTRWGTRRFWFTDAQFISGREGIPHCVEVLEGIVASGMKIEWSGYIRTSLITPDLARLMVQSGLGDLEVSITSGTQKVLNKLTMGFKLEDLYQGCRYLKEAGFRGKIILNYSLNSPGETEETLLDSVNSYKRIAAIMGEEQVVPLLFFLGVQPHTDFEKMLMEEDYLPEGYDPLSMNPFTIKKMLYNPAPLNKIIAQTCVTIWDEKVKGWREKGQWAVTERYANEALFRGVMGNSGKDVLLTLERLLKNRQTSQAGGNILR